MAPFEVGANRSGPGDNLIGRDGGDDWSDDALHSQRALVRKGDAKMDSEEARREHRRLLQWFYYERERQAPNRLEMAMDHDFYDNLQWDAQDAADLRERGQMPLVYNEIAPMVDWLIGTERRTRVDWRVVPRTEDDVQMASIKTDVLKYVSDVNRVPYLRSRAAADAFKGGVGWMDDGATDDPTQDVLFSKYEDWRRVLWDSDSYELDLSDARYLFRWRWVDLDVAIMMFPGRAEQIMAAAEDASSYGINSWDDDEITIEGTAQAEGGGTLLASGSMTIDAKRRRVRLIECQYRKPVSVKVVTAGTHKGSLFDERDTSLVDSIKRTGASIADRVMMRVHCAVFTETDMLDMGPSLYRHNRFSLTPIWCYRRNRDRMPYGVIRRVRDVQQDLNKRASKALFMLNTNQIIADEGAVEDWDVARDEVSRPDGTIIKKPGKAFDIRRDTDGATGQIQIMAMDAQSIQKAAGVSQENMGRQTNAVSGEAIKARQIQGSVVTTEPLDNLRYATQIQGEKQLSLCEQFYTEEKVLRLTGAKGAIKWLRVNQPEQQPDGSVRYINDITASAADFLVSEQDYAGTMRQVMFDSLNEIAGRLPPEVALRLLTMAFEYSDLPNKDEIADQMRKITGEQDPDKELSPEEEQQAQAQQQQQAEAMQLQREQAMTALKEQQAKVRKLLAEAMKLEAEVQAVGAGDGGAQMQQAMQQAVMQVQQDADRVIEKLTADLRAAKAEMANRTMQVRSDADSKLEVARIDADAKIRIAEIQADADRAMRQSASTFDDLRAALEQRLGALEQGAQPVASV